MSSRHTLLAAVSEHHKKQGPTLIAVGLVALLAAEYWSAIPVISAIASIALGATLTVALRFRYSSALPAMVTAHLFVYVSLYILFVGAVIHASYTKFGGMTFLQGADLGLSIAPMVAAIRIALAAMAGDEDVPAR